MNRTLDALIRRLKPHSLNPEAELDTILKLKFDISLIQAKITGISPGILKKVEEILEERISTGKPIQYILGKALFYDRIFYVNEHVLIPRAETELLVEKAIELITKKGIRKIVDVGTGSGIIAITLKKEIPELDVYATDISEQAIKVAKANASYHGVDIKFVVCDLLTCLDTDFNMVISNPPYLGYNEPYEKYRRFEPEIALMGGKRGFELSHQLLNQAINRLKKPGYIIMEINPFTVQDFVKNLRDYELFEDFNGFPRVLVIKNG